MNKISRFLLFLLFASLTTACTDDPNENSNQTIEDTPTLPATDELGNRIDAVCTKAEEGNYKCSNTDPDYLYICNGQYYRRAIGCDFGCNGKDACNDTAPLGTICKYGGNGSWCDNNNIVWCDKNSPSVVAEYQKCENNTECVRMKDSSSAYCINKSIQCKAENERIGWCETVNGKSAEGSYVCKFAKDGSLVPVNQYDEYLEYKLCSNGCNDTNTACK